MAIGIQVFDGIKCVTVIKKNLSARIIKLQCRTHMLIYKTQTQNTFFFLILLSGTSTKLWPMSIHTSTYLEYTKTVQISSMYHTLHEFPPIFVHTSFEYSNLGYFKDVVSVMPFHSRFLSLDLATHQLPLDLICVQKILFLVQRVQHQQCVFEHDEF